MVWFLIAFRMFKNQFQICSFNPKQAESLLLGFTCSAGNVFWFLQTHSQCFIQPAHAEGKSAPGGPSASLHRVWPWLCVCVCVRTCHIWRVQSSERSDWWNAKCCGFFFFFFLQQRIVSFFRGLLLAYPIPPFSVSPYTQNKQHARSLCFLISHPPSSSESKGCFFFSQSDKFSTAEHVGFC